MDKEITPTSKETETETEEDDDFEEFAKLVGTKKPTLADKIQVISKKITGKSRKLRASWSIEPMKELRDLHERLKRRLR